MGFALHVRLTTFTTLGLRAVPVEVEIDSGIGLPGITLVGLPDQTVKEARERVRAALLNSNFRIPNIRFTVNLAPADLKKEGGVFDLPIALGLLAASKQLEPSALEGKIFSGELALDGSIRAVSGMLPMALAAASKDALLVIPEGNRREAALVDGLRLLPARCLYDLVCHLNGLAVLPEAAGGAPEADAAAYDVDFAEVRGQAHAKRALEVVAAGGHHVLMVGPPGSGKTMLAQRLPTIQPQLSNTEALETLCIHSVAGTLAAEAALRRRPFRAPHHTASHAALVGGGTNPRPGEVSLAHNGVLFLDELAEFRRDVLESLREPLEEGLIRVSRAKQSLNFPARFTLVAAMNPCPCGHLTNPARNCRCSSTQIQKYLAKLSGPLLDRIDLHIDVPAVPVETLQRADTPAESSAGIQARVIAARERQSERYRGLPYATNARLRARELHRMCPLAPRAASLLRSALREFSLSARSYGKILKVARTIADLAGSERLEEAHVAEAVQYRTLDRRLWE